MVACAAIMLQYLGTHVLNRAVPPRVEPTPALLYVSVYLLFCCGRFVTQIWETRIEANGVERHSQYDTHGTLTMLEGLSDGTRACHTSDTSLP